MTPRRRRLAATVTILVAAACTACSSGSSGGAAGPVTSTTRATTTAPAARRSSVPNPTVTGPITGGRYGIPYLGMPKAWFDRFHYREDEYFISGTAAAYQAKGALGTDGRWDVARTDDTAAYETRIVVRRPTDPARFSGTVVVEWLNVSAGRDSDPDFGFLGEQLLRDGDAYIAVSAQKIGVEPGGLGIPIPNVPPEALAPLKTWDPQRYGDLHHPGDQYSYDIFSQAARTALDTGKGSVLGGLRVRHLIAAGESQSAFRMVTYVNAIEPTTRLFDGFLVHSRGDAAADLNDTQKPPSGTHIRTDGTTATGAVPVLQFETETDLDLLQFVKARQDDGPRVVTWETAGTAHVDRSTLDYAVTAGRRWTTANVDLSTSCGAINEGPQPQVVNAAFHHLERWVADGTAPPRSPRLDVAPDGTIARDDLGIAKGGIRTPAVDAPTEVLTGENPTPAVICSLFGSSAPLTDAQLHSLYASHEAYVADVTRSAHATEAAGFILAPAAKAFIADAKAANIPPKQ